MLPAPAASNKASRRSSNKVSTGSNPASPAPADGEDGGAVGNPFPVDSPHSPSADFDPLASPVHGRGAAGKGTPVQPAAPAVQPQVAAPAPAPTASGDVVADFDWLLSGAKKANTTSPAPANTTASAAGSAAGADPLTVPEGGDPFDVFWTGGGAPRPLPDSDPWPTAHHHSQASSQSAAAADGGDDSGGEEPAQSAAVVKKKPTTAAAGSAAAGTASDRKAPPGGKKLQPKNDDSDDDVKTLTASAAVSAASPPEAKRTGPFVVKVDVLKFMKKGCSLLKFGSYGYPHFRQFQLSSDQKKLMWYSAGKAISESQIDLRDVDEIALGQHTDKFGKHKEVTQLEKSSFSVYYNYRKKTLDVIAKDPNEFMVWTRGLSELVKRAQKNENLSQLSELILELTMVPNRRTNADIIDATTGKSIVELIAAAAPAASVEDTHDKGRYKAIGENLAYMRKRVVKYSDKLKQSQYYMSPQYNTMKELLKKLTDAANKVSDAFHAGQFALCDDELWRANVDLESLKNMMKAIDASID